MKILTLWQPWASLVGFKLIETRSFLTKYRGLVAIHAGLKKTEDIRKVFYQEPFFSHLRQLGYNEFEQLPFGKIISVARITDCKKIVMPTIWTPEFGDFIMKPPPEPEFSFGDYTQYRYGWFLEGVSRLKDPIACAGKVGLMDLEEPYLGQLMTSTLVNNF